MELAISLPFVKYTFGICVVSRRGIVLSRNLILNAYFYPPFTPRGSYLNNTLVTIFYKCIT
jgi:hypothetical protein